MTPLHDDINALVNEFVTKVTDLARRAAVETLRGALEGEGAGPARAVARGRRDAAGDAGGRVKGAKRAPAELAKLQEQVKAFIEAHAGLRIEQINKELNTTTRDLALPLRKLIADGAIHTKGEKRATTYHPGEGGRARRKKG